VTVLLDVEGLAPYAEPYEVSAYIELLGLKYDAAIENRIEALAALREGAGITVLTGPLGAAFWSLASIEVTIKVVPDDYQYTQRETPLVWAMTQCGIDLPTARTLSKAPPKTAKHKWYSAYEAALALVRTLDNTVVEPLVHEATPFEVLSIEEGIELLETLATTKELAAVDWEWHRQTQQPVGLAVSTEHRNCYVPVWGSDYDRRGDGHQLQAQFSSALARGARFILHGGQADLGTQVPGDPADLLGTRIDLEDTMVMAYLCGEDVLGLKDLTKKYLGKEPIENEYEWAEMPVRFTARYAAAGDTRNTYDLFHVLQPILADHGQMDVYYNIEVPLIPRLASMEKFGVPIDVAETKRQYRDTVAIEQGVRRAVMENYGRDLKYDEEARAFITDFGFPDPGTLDQRVISLNEHWCIDLILLFRTSRTRRRNFLGKNLLLWYCLNNEGKEHKLTKSEKERLHRMRALWSGDVDDFRVFPHYNQAGSMDQEAKRAPRSGRLSSSGPNIQQQPRSIRAIYKPPKGYKWWSYDYSGLELHIAAAVSGDKEMVETLSKGGDLHGLFQTRIRELTGVPVERPHAKTGNFEQLYFGGAAQLVRILAKQRAFITMDTARAICTGHEKTFTGYHETAAEIRAMSRYRGYSETLAGRRRYMVEYLTGDPEQIAHADKACVNHTIQGTGADIVKRAMNELTNTLRKHNAHLALQVHDELDGWIAEDADLEAFDREVREVMTKWPVKGKATMTLKVEGGLGLSWDETH